MSARGIIRNEDRAKQINDFSGLRFERGITPTDVDGLIDFNNKQFILFEVKYGAAPLPDGQRMALERLRNAVARAGIDAWLLVLEHHVADPSIPVDVASTMVRQWANNDYPALVDSRRQITARQAIDYIHNKGNA